MRREEIIFTLCLFYIESNLSTIGTDNMPISGCPPQKPKTKKKSRISEEWSGGYVSAFIEYQ